MDDGQWTMEVIFTINIVHLTSYILPLTSYIGLNS